MHPYKKKYKSALWVQRRDRDKKPVKKAWKPIRSRTSKRASQELKYRKRVRQRLSDEQPICAVSKLVPSIRPQRATQCHHKFGRQGRLLLWEPGWIFVSADGHLWIDCNREEARMLGLLCEVGQFNDQSIVKDSDAKNI